RRRQPKRPAKGGVDERGSNPTKAPFVGSVRDCDRVAGDQRRTPRWVADRLPTQASVVAPHRAMSNRRFQRSPGLSSPPGTATLKKDPPIVAAPSANDRYFAH